MEYPVDLRSVAARLGAAGRHVREQFGLTVEEAAIELDFVYLDEFERGRWDGDASVALDRFLYFWGVDLMIVGALLFVTPEKMPLPLREPTRALHELWQKRFEQIVKERQERSGGQP